MPKPTEGENQKDFVARCIPIVMDDGTAPKGDNKQAAAICFSMWKENMKGKSLSLSVTLKTDPTSGRVRWKAIANSGEFDAQGDRFDESFFDDIVTNFWAVQDAVSRGEATLPGFAHPEGMPVPQLDVAHYSFQLQRSDRVKARAGVPTFAYRDGHKLILQGHFETTPLGRAASKSVLEDERDIIKTSIGVWPDWNRVETLPDDRRIFKGGAGVSYLDHLGLTAHPVDAGADINAEGGQMAKSLKVSDDALEVLGDEKLVAELEQARATVKSEPPTGALVKAKNPDDFITAGDSEFQVKEAGTPNHDMMTTAYAAIMKYTGDGKEEAVKALKALYASEKMTWPADEKKSLAKDITMGHMGTEFEPEETTRILAAMDAQDIPLAQQEIQSAIDHVKARMADKPVAESTLAESIVTLHASPPRASWARMESKPVAESIVTVTEEYSDSVKKVTTVEKDKVADAIDAENAKLAAQAMTQQAIPENDIMMQSEVLSGGRKFAHIFDISEDKLYIPELDSLAKSIQETQSALANAIKALGMRLDVLEKSTPALGEITALASALNNAIEATKTNEAQKVKSALDNHGWLDIVKLYSARSAPDNVVTVDGGVRRGGPQETEPQAVVGGPIAGRFIRT